ncbi:MAG: hypothetical protein RR284_08125, partial [Ruthenibacterium sp.]
MNSSDALTSDSTSDSQMLSNPLNDNSTGLATTEQPMFFSVGNNPMPAGGGTVTELSIQKITDGTAPFDDVSGAGNDTKDDNKIVRTFDTVNYTFKYSTQVVDPKQIAFSSGKLFVEFEIPNTKEQVTFEDNAMSWLEDYKVVESEGKQICSGWYLLEGDSQKPVAIPGSGTITATVNTKVLANGAVLQLKARAWLEGETSLKEADADAITVSAAPKYNVQIKESGGSGTPVGTFDGVHYTRLAPYSVTLQLYNDTTQKGMKGIEIPVGDISFDVEMRNVKSVNGIESNVTSSRTPIFWDTQKNQDSNITEFGMSGKSLRFNGQPYITLPGASPFYTNHYGDELYSIADTNNDTLIATRQEAPILGTADDHTTTHFSVSGYDFGDFKSFPVKNIYSANETDYTKNIGCFAVGNLYFLIPVAKNPIEVADYFARASVRNFNATSVGGLNVTSEQKTDDKRLFISKSTDEVKRIPWGSVVEQCIMYDYTMASDILQGDSAAFAGTDIMAWSGMVSAVGAHREQWAHNVNMYLKIDPSAFEVPAWANSETFLIATQEPLKDGTTYTKDNIRLQYIGATQGSPQAWPSGENIGNTGKPSNDSLGANPDDSTYFGIGDLAFEENENGYFFYNTMAELNAAGKICYGVKIIITDPDGAHYSNHITEIGVPLKVRDSVTTGTVYALENEVYFWDWGNPTPHAIGTQNCKVTQHYRKAIYDENRNIKSTTNTLGITGGQSLFIPALEARIQKTTLQTNADGSTKQTYDLSKNQTRVDYKLTAVISASKKAGRTTNLTIIDYLPPNMSYVLGSARLNAGYNKLPDDVNGGEI